jgi:hypothetical protein
VSRRILVPAVGLLLFGFIPLVLYLYVGHPEPLWLSLVAGVLVMLGHRFLARPYMRWARPQRCLWCGRVPPREPAERLPVEAGGGGFEAVCCQGHAVRAARFFAFVDDWRWPLRIGIFLPLLFLLGSLVADAAGREAAPVELATDLFRLAVGLTVNLAAWGWLAVRRAPETARVPFPVHNFYLLGVHALLWVFRVIGVWWIWMGARGLLGG